MRVHDQTRVPEFLQMLDDLFKTHLEIGVFGEDDSEIVMIASVHEFGVDIRVTDKMRNYLHSIGIHLKGDTTHVKIPERSFLRGSYDQEKENIVIESERLLRRVIALELPVNTFYQTLGELIVGKVQRYLTDLRNPPNTPATITNKGSSNPLINTGRLRQSITYKIVRN